MKKKIMFFMMLIFVMVFIGCSNQNDIKKMQDQVTALTLEVDNLKGKLVTQPAEKVINDMNAVIKNEQPAVQVKKEDVKPEIKNEMKANMNITNGTVKSEPSTTANTVNKNEVKTNNVTKESKTVLQPKK